VHFVSSWTNLTVPSPKPRPARLKLLGGRHEGVDSGGRKVEQPPEFRRVTPTMPEELSPEAAEHWTLIVDELARLELTKPIDAGALAALCEAWSRFWRAQRTVNQLADAELFADGRIHPAWRAAEAASREYRQLAVEFGLTPSSEGRLGTMTMKRTDVGENPFGGREDLA
jgi:P27 family predicted phage terminase small subunit